MRIRKANASLNEKQKIAIGMLWFVLIGISVAVDTFIPFNPYLNVIRTIIAITLGVVLYSYVYIFSLKKSDKKAKDDELYMTIRERFSYNQRRNISVVAWGLWAMFLLLGSEPNQFFTLFSSLMVFFAISILAFMRSTRNEDQQSKLGLSDSRDIRFEQARKEELKRRKELESNEKDD